MVAALRWVALAFGWGVLAGTAFGLARVAAQGYLDQGLKLLTVRVLLDSIAVYTAAALLGGLLAESNEQGEEPGDLLLVEIALSSALAEEQGVFRLDATGRVGQEDAEAQEHRCEVGGGLLRRCSPGSLRGHGPEKDVTEFVG